MASDLRPMRFIFALLLAALTPAILLVVPILIDGIRYFHGSHIGYALRAAFIVGQFAFMVALLHAILLGLPAFIVLQKFNVTFWWTSLIFGFLIGLIPFAIFSWPMGKAGSSYRAYDGTQIVDYVINGIPTRAGWISYIKNALEVGCIGMVSAFLSWLVWQFYPSSKLDKQSL